jgi:hypothetical protein
MFHIQGKLATGWGRPTSMHPSSHSQARNLALCKSQGCLDPLSSGHPRHHLPQALKVQPYFSRQSTEFIPTTEDLKDFG